VKKSLLFFIVLLLSQPLACFQLPFKNFFELHKEFILSGSAPAAPSFSTESALNTCAAMGGFFLAKGLSSLASGYVARLIPQDPVLVKDIANIIIATNPTAVTTRCAADILDIESRLILHRATDEDSLKIVRVITAGIAQDTCLTFGAFSIGQKNYPLGVGLLCAGMAFSIFQKAEKIKLVQEVKKEIIKKNRLNMPALISAVGILEFAQQ